MDQGASQSPSTSTEPVRSRWSPKPEQILILESIFNSGIVNPPKDETVRIRKMLEKFGAVGDANVFYWFQNRRSRSRRRQRQLQAATAAAATSRGPEDHQHMTAMSMHQYPYSNSEIDLGFGSCSNSSANYLLNGTSSSSQVNSFLLGLSSSNDGCESNNGMENLFTMYGHESYHHHHQQHSSNAPSILSPSDENSNFQYQQGESFICMADIVALIVARMLQRKKQFQARERIPEIATEDNTGVYHFLGCVKVNGLPTQNQLAMSGLAHIPYILLKVLPSF